MIRPFTLLCVLLAGFSGLFLYSKKHQTTVLDGEIASIVRDTQHIREQTSMLRAEWALLNQPDRLKTLSDKFLPSLGSMKPTQFIQLASLAGHLPAPTTTPLLKDPREAISRSVAAEHAQPAPHLDEIIPERKPLLSHKSEGSAPKNTHTNNSASSEEKQSHKADAVGTKISSTHPITENDEDENEDFPNPSKKVKAKSDLHRKQGSPENNSTSSAPLALVSHQSSSSSHVGTSVRNHSHKTEVTDASNEEHAFTDRAEKTNRAKQRTSVAANNLVAARTHSKISSHKVEKGDEKENMHLASFHAPAHNQSVQTPRRANSATPSTHTVTKIAENTVRNTAHHSRSSNSVLSVSSQGALPPPVPFADE